MSGKIQRSNSVAAVIVAVVAGGAWAQATRPNKLAPRPR